MTSINRREFMKMGLTAGSLLALGNSSDLFTRSIGKTETAKKIIILGADGMDPHLLEVWMNAGKLPAFAKLRSQGAFSRLQTSFPPQSPVAWANFITGMNPGGHGIFDFMIRHPENYIPAFSSTKTEGSQKNIRLGNLILPLSGGKVTQRRHGKAFWQILEEHDIPATIFKIPANYPPASTKQRTLSGMNTPDILGTYGTYNYYTTGYAKSVEETGGGRQHEVYVIGNRIDAKILGPPNTFKKEEPETSADFKVYLDPVNPVAKISLQGQEFILREKEWSPWKKVRFPMIPTQNVNGICMFYLKQLRPEFELYVSPINIDPSDPALPISTPKSYSKELAETFGPFFTKGLPADTAALEQGALDEESFLEQDDMIMQERAQMFEYELDRFDSGVLFYYISSTDQRQHMFWRLLDKSHPVYDEKLAAQWGDSIEKIYKETDRLLDRILRKADKDTLVMVLSDHGFAPFRWSFNVNTWLKEYGYLSLRNAWDQGRESFHLNTDWGRTKAYAYGLNSLYINQQGREGEGIVQQGRQKQALMREIAQKLENYIDPKTGKKPILRAALAKDIYQGNRLDAAPDIILGYNHGYRVSWTTPLGKTPKNIIEDNTEKWSGDHMASPEIVPGVLLMNQKINASSPALYDLTPTILKTFGIRKPKEMIGNPVI